MSIRQFLATRTMIYVLLVFQFVPMVLFPAESFSLSTQEWWLPVVLAVLTLISIIQIFRHSVAVWPWNLISFSQGFNIISRLMMILPHSTLNLDGKQYFDTPYVLLSIISMLLSAFLLWYTELPDVRMGLYSK